MTLFPSAQDIETDNRIQRLQMHLLTGATVIALAFGMTSTALHLQDADPLQFPGVELPGVELPSIERIMEWRPQGPPPWMDMDQFTPDEAEQPTPMAAGDREMRGRESARTRTER